MDYRQTVIAAWAEAEGAYSDYAAALSRQQRLEVQFEMAVADVTRQEAIAAKGGGTKLDVLRSRLARNEQGLALADERLGAIAAWAKTVKATFVPAGLPQPQAGPPLGLDDEVPAPTACCFGSEFR